MPLPELDPADYQDLRLAVIMNGGVSLAVWIGGVALELHQFEKTSGPYAELLDFVATRVQADVIAGSSAGGINGAFLAAARAYDSDLSALRDVWIDKGALENLLRPASDSEAQSLLRGQYFLDELQKAFLMLTRGSPTDAAAFPVDLTLTATLLHGAPNILADDFGMPICDSSHRASFHFRRDRDGDDFCGPDIAEQLALASRSTASFPIAFEPQFVEVLEGARQSNICSFNAASYLIDGGILDNKPLDHAIEAVRKQREQGDVRRVLCYVVPSPQAPATNDPDSKDQPPTVREVAVASLAGIPLAQSISGELRQVGDHNRLVREFRSTRRAIASLGWEQVEAIAARVFQSYQYRRVVSLATYIAEEASRGIAAEQPAPLMGRRRKEWLVNLFLEEFQKNKNLPWVPVDRPSHGKNVPRADAWNWGVFTAENIASVVLDVLRQGIRLLPVYTQPGQAERQAKITLRAKLSEAREQYIQLTRLRQSSDMSWRQRGKCLRFEDEPGRKWVQECIAQAGGQQIANDAGACAYAFARLLLEAAGSLQTAAACSTGKAGALGFPELVKLLVIGDAPLAPHQILERLLNLEVVQFGFGISSAVRSLADQILELAEISAGNSADTAVGLSAGKRPLGAQLAAFGGFYKRSWRAFDWTLGRLHGLERMLRVILDPERIEERCHALPDASAAVLQELQRLAVPQEGPDRNACQKWWAEHQPQVEKEISRLLTSNVVPEQLPATVKALLCRFELAVLREELPNLAVAVQQDISERHSPRLGQQLLDVMRTMVGPLGALTTAPGEVVSALWSQCRIDGETFEEEMDTDPFIATLTQASVVGTTLLAAEQSGLGPVRKVFALFRWPARLAYLLACSLIAESKSAVALFVFIFTVSLTIASLPFATDKISIPRTWRFGALGVWALATVLFLLISPVRRVLRRVWRSVRKKHTS